MLFIKSDFLREIWEFRESNENTLFRNFYGKLFFQFLSKFSFNLRKKLSSFGRRFLFVYWSNSKMTGRNSNPTIERKRRRWIFVYLCQSPWKSPSTSVIRCFLQLKRAMCRNHTHESRGGAFAGAPKGTQKLWTLSPVSQLGYPSPTTFSNPIESDTSQRGKKFPNLFFCTFLRGDRSYGYFITQWEKLPTFMTFWNFLYWFILYLLNNFWLSMSTKKNQQSQTKVNPIPKLNQFQPKSMIFGSFGLTLDDFWVEFKVDLCWILVEIWLILGSSGLPWVTLGWFRVEFRLILG